MTLSRAAPVVRVDPTDPAPSDLADAAAHLRRGGLVGFPTETVYGLGANALDGDAVARVFAAKGRPADNPVIVHLADPADLPSVARTVGPLAAELAARWWPGPLTLVLDAHPSVPRVTTGGHATVGVRVPAHPVARALIAAAGVPVAAPSANRSGRPSPTTAAHVLDDLGPALDAIVDGGPCRVGVESTVVDARGARPQVLREGAITREDLAAPPPSVSDEAKPGASPGTRYRHYAPACRIELAADVAGRSAELAATGARVGALAPTGAIVPDDVVVIARFAAVADLARGLYDALRAAESAGVDVLVAPLVERRGLGRAVADRLDRAAAG